MIHGLILIDKPPGITSHTVVDNVRKLFKIKKVGHFGFHPTVPGEAEINDRIVKRRPMMAM